MARYCRHHPRRGRVRERTDDYERMEPPRFTAADPPAPPPKLREMFVRMHRAGVEACMYYDARFGVSVYGGLFNPLTAKPFSTYYSFVAFNALYRAGTQVACEADAPLIAMAAAGENGQRLALIVNTTNTETALTLEAAPRRCAFPWWRTAKPVSSGDRFPTPAPCPRMPSG